MHKPLRHLEALNKEYLFIVSNCDSAFTEWNTLTSSKLQTPTIMEDESSGESEQHCYRSNGMTPLRYTRKLN